MPKVTKQKTQAVWRRRLADIALSILATPLNLLAIVLRLMWSTRRVRLASVALLIALAATALFRFAPFQPAADYVQAQAYRLSGEAGFRIDDITVEGRVRTQKADLAKAVQLQLKTPIFAIDLDDVHARVQQLPWVGETVVTRRLPNILHISIREREPFALYRDESSLMLIDDTGAKITGNHLLKFAHLPTFLGDGSRVRAADLMRTLHAYPVIRNRLVAAEWVGQRRWTLQLDHGGAVHLPDGDIATALDRLMELERDRRILAIENQAIDLRLPDRILLRPEGQRSSQTSATKRVEAS